MESSKQKRSLIEASRTEPKSKEPVKNLEESKKSKTDNSEILTTENQLAPGDDFIGFILEKLSQLAACFKVLEDNLAELKKHNREKISGLESEDEEMKRTVNKIEKKMTDFEKKSNQIRQKFESKIDKGINENSKKESELRQKLESKIETKIQKINEEIVKLQGQISPVNDNSIESAVKEAKSICKRIEKKFSAIEVLKKNFENGEWANELVNGLKVEIKDFKTEMSVELRKINEKLSEFEEKQEKSNKEREERMEKLNKAREEKMEQNLKEFEGRLFQELEKIIKHFK